MPRPVINTRRPPQNPGRRERGPIRPRPHQTGRSAHRARRPHRPAAPVRTVKIRRRVKAAWWRISWRRPASSKHWRWRWPTASAPERWRPKTPASEPWRWFESRTRPISRQSTSSKSNKQHTQLYFFEMCGFAPT